MEYLFIVTIVALVVVGGLALTMAFRLHEVQDEMQQTDSLFARERNSRLVAESQLEQCRKTSEGRKKSMDVLTRELEQTNKLAQEYKSRLQEAYNELNKYPVRNENGKLEKRTVFHTV